MERERERETERETEREREKPLNLKRNETPIFFFLWRLKWKKEERKVSFPETFKKGQNFFRRNKLERLKTINIFTLVYH